MSEGSVFSPNLGKEYCVYFLYLTIFSFIFLVLTIVDASYAVIKGEIPVVTGILSLAAPFILYLSNRILYSMCSQSLP